MKINYSSPLTVAAKAAFLFCLSTAVLFQIGCTSTSGSGSAASIRGQTYTISMLSPQGTPYERSALATLAPVAVDAVNTTLGGKGYREAPAANADLLVRLSGKFAPDFKSDVSKVTGEITPTVTTESAQHRVLLIEVLDNRTKNTIWSDSRAGSGATTPTPERIRTVIAEMLAPLPNASPSQ